MVVGEEYPIIILTAYDWSDVEQEAREAGVTAFVSKPLFLSELREVLMSQAQRELLKNEKQKDQAKNRKSYAGKKVLLVEDNELNREIATAIMKEIGLEVETAEDGTDAVNIMSSAEGRKYDLIFMDAAKGQYIHFLDDVLRLLAPEGVLVSDNVLQDGDVAKSRYAIERRDRTIHKRMRDYLYTIKNHPQLETTILPVGDGVAISIKMGESNERR